MLSLVESAIAAEESLARFLIRSKTEGGIGATAYSYSAFGTANPPTLDLEYSTGAGAHSRLAIALGVGL